MENEASNGDLLGIGIAVVLFIVFMLWATREPKPNNPMIKKEPPEELEA